MKVRARGIALVGCGCVAIAVVVLAVLLAYNWPAISGLYARAAASMAELSGVQSALQEEYETPQVAVLWRSAPSPALVVRMTNPPFLKELALEDAEPKAREVASSARAHMREPGSVPMVEVALTKQSGFGVTVSTSRVFRFTGSDLGQPTPRAK